MSISMTIVSIVRFSSSSCFSYRFSISRPLSIVTIVTISMAITMSIVSKVTISMTIVAIVRLSSSGCFSFSLTSNSGKQTEGNNSLKNHNLDEEIFTKGFTHNCLHGGS